MMDPQKMTDDQLRDAVSSHHSEVDHLQRSMDDMERAARPLLEEKARRQKEREERESMPKLTAAMLFELRPVFEAAARADQPLVEYHGRRLGIELLPLHGREVK